MELYTLEQITLGFLAGGKGQRLKNRDKGLLVIDGQPQIGRLIDQIPEHRTNVFIVCRRNAWLYAHYATHIFCDASRDQGPTAGVVALLDACHTSHLAIIPCDQQHIPSHWRAWLQDAGNHGDTGYFATEAGQHTPLSLIPTNQKNKATDYYDGGGRSLFGLYQALALSPLECPGAASDIDMSSQLNALGDH